MSTCFARRLGNLRLTLATNVAALAAPTVAGDGVAIPDTWKAGPQKSRYRQVALEILGVPLGAKTLSGLILWGYDGTNWWNRATYGTLTIPAGGGASTLTTDWATDERIAVSATISAGNVTVYATPYEALAFGGC